MRNEKIIRNNRDALSIIKRKCRSKGITLGNFAKNSLHITLSAMYRRIRFGSWSDDLLVIIYSELQLSPNRLLRHNWNSKTWAEMLKSTSVYRPKTYFNSRINRFIVRDWED